jgi:hypothetical protein
MARPGAGAFIALWLMAAAWVFSVPAPAHAQALATAPPLKVLVMIRLTPPHYRPDAEYSTGYGDERDRRDQRRLAERIAHDHGLQMTDDWPMPLLGLDCFIMTLPAHETDLAVAQKSVESMAQTLAREPGVVWAEPMHVYHAQAAASAYNDPLFLAQPAARAWRLASLHQVATGRGVSVAVIDSQVDRAHPDLVGQIAVSADFTQAPPAAERHGTAVAGIIAAAGGNGLGIVGVAPNARLMALRACWQPSTLASSTVCDSVSLAKALHYGLEHNAQVINLSLSGPPDLLVDKLLDIALRRGVTVVAAFDPDLPHGGFPASHSGVISVSDEALVDAPAGVYAAPGRDVPTTQPGGRWALVDGSSYAAAHVSGLVALMRERRPRMGSVAPALTSGRGGWVEACATLLGTSPACDCTCAPSSGTLATAR